MIQATLSNNYRGITVCSCLGKFFTLIINDRLTKYLDEHNIVHNNPTGFRKGYRTSDHVFVLKSLIDLYTIKINRYTPALSTFKRPMTQFGETAFSIS